MPTPHHNFIPSLPLYKCSLVATLDPICLFDMSLRNVVLISINIFSQRQNVFMLLLLISQVTDAATSQKQSLGYGVLGGRCPSWFCTTQGGICLGTVSACPASRPVLLRDTSLAEGRLPDPEIKAEKELPQPSLEDNFSGLRSSAWLGGRPMTTGPAPGSRGSWSLGGPCEVGQALRPQLVRK